MLDLRVELERGMSVAPRIALALIVANVVAFAWQLTSGSLESVESLVAAGAQEKSTFLAGEVWRLWSATLLHGSIDHLVGNMIALFILGMICEHVFGRAQTVILYVGSALLGSLASVFTLDPGMPAVGASGAVFGLMGASVVVLFRNRHRIHMRDNRIGTVLLCWALYILVMGLMTPFVDNAAHVGGFLGGGAIALGMRPLLLDKGKPLSRPVQALGFAACAGATILTVIWLLRCLSS